MSESRIVVVVSLAVLALIAFAWPSAWRGETDFLSFYAGAKLAGTPDLYSYRQANAIQRHYSKPEEVRAYIRPPFYALVLWPLGRLPYRSASFVWQLLNLCAVAGSILLARSRTLAAILMCWSFPLWMNFATGQDIPIVLLTISLSSYLFGKQREFWAGLLFAFCGIKYHLFLLAPILILARRLWRFGGGFAAGGAGLLGISFLVAGWDWPVRYYQLLRMNETEQVSQSYMPNLLGLLHSAPGAKAWILLLTALIAGAVWREAGRQTFEYALACTLAGSLLISPHAFIYDCALLIPLFLALAGTTGPGFALVMATCSGLAALALTAPRISALGPITVLLIFAFAVYRNGGLWKGELQPTDSP